MHFAVVCASIGCPNLRPEAFTFDKLEAQLEDQTLSYLSSAKGVKLDFEKNRVCVSQLFNWYTGDFVQDPPTGFRIGKRSEKERIAFQFISHYLTELRAWELLQSPDTEFDFLSYDWSLNELPPKDD
jgi:hypothetical protein